MPFADRPILVLDSGIGGLSVLRELRRLMPARHFVYVADNAAFPYGERDESVLREHLLTLFKRLLPRFQPALTVLACNTASTLIIQDLRQAFPRETFVGTVPAIKPAAERSRSGLISVLATPGTVRRQYTRDLIREWAPHCQVQLVGSQRLAPLAETWVCQGHLDEAVLREEIRPCFVEIAGRRTDTVILACTHYPFLLDALRRQAPWPVDWLDPAEAIARRTQSLLVSDSVVAVAQPNTSCVLFTAGRPDTALLPWLADFGLRTVIDL